MTRTDFILICIAAMLALMIFLQLQSLQIQFESFQTVTSSINSLLRDIGNSRIE